MKTAGKLRSEFVISVTGNVRLRPTGQENPKISTGEIEIDASDVTILNEAETPPFVPGQKELPNEDTRLKHRYIDLRRKQMQETLVLRSRIIKAMRDYCAEHNFIDVETPILGRSTPEGARDYLVPSRVHNGKFYALPQSPSRSTTGIHSAGHGNVVRGF